MALPLAVLSGWYLDRLNTEAEAVTERRIVRSAGIIATRVAARLQDMTVMIRVLANSPELADGNFGALHARTQSALRVGHWHMILVDGEGNQLLNTRVPYGTPLGATSNMEILEAAMADNRAHVSNAFFGQTSGKWVFNVIHAVDLVQPHRRGAMILTQNAEELAPDMKGAELPNQWHSVLVDGNRIVLAGDNTLQVGEALSPEIATSFDGPSGFFGERNGDEIVGGYSTVPGTDWHSIVYGPWSAAFDINVSVAMRNLMWWFALTLISVVVIAWLLARIVNRAVSDLVRMARDVGGGKVATPIHTPVSELNVLADSLSAASKSRSAAQTSENIIRQELVHRVKNLFSIVQAVVNQSARGAGSTSELRTNVAERISGLGRSIDLLVAADWHGVSLRQLVERQLNTFADVEERTTIEGPQVELRPEAVQALGMAFHELATNAMKYGAFSVPGGRIVVRWTVSGNGQGSQIRLEWREERGPLVSPSVEEGFGSRIIRDNVSSTLNADVTLEFMSEGLRWSMHAPTQSILLDDALETASS